MGLRADFPRFPTHGAISARCCADIKAIKTPNGGTAAGWDEYGVSISSCHYKCEYENSLLVTVFSVKDGYL